MSKVQRKAQVSTREALNRAVEPFYNFLQINVITSDWINCTFAPIGDEPRCLAKQLQNISQHLDILLDWVDKNGSIVSIEARP
jgi:hypothetical protein